MIQWLRENEANISRTKKGKVIFDFAGRDLVARLELIEQIEKQKI